MESVLIGSAILRAQRILQIWDSLAEEVSARVETVLSQTSDPKTSWRRLKLDTHVYKRDPIERVYPVNSHREKEVSIWNSGMSSVRLKNVGNKCSRLIEFDTQP
jgi:hypothetical protein